MDKARIRKRLQGLACKYAFYLHPEGETPFFLANCEVFPSASIIKIPLLLVWLKLEAQGILDRNELCDLDAQPQVKGAGLSWLFHARRIPYADVLMLMITLSDNLCTNLVIQRIGIERANRIFRDELGLKETQLSRLMMDFRARAEGIENWVSAADCIHLYSLIQQLPIGECRWVEDMLGQCQDHTLFQRDLGVMKTALFYHKTCTLHDVRHDWGYTRACKVFLLTWGFADELRTLQVFGNIGRTILVDAEKSG